MSDLTFVEFDRVSAKGGGGVRWWVLRGPQGAVSLVAHIQLADDRVPEGMSVISTDGTRLVAGAIGIHRRPSDGDPEAMPDCPALEGPCRDGGTSFRSAEATLRQWGAVGCDDGLIRAELQQWYDAEFGPAS